MKLLDAQALCASARFCHRAGEIWNLVPKSDNSEAKKIAIEEACDCPSGRLVVCDKKTGKMIEPELEKSIGLIEDPQKAVRRANLGIAGGSKSNQLTARLMKFATELLSAVAENHRTNLSATAAIILNDMN